MKISGPVKIEREKKVVGMIIKYIRHFITRIQTKFHNDTVINMAVNLFIMLAYIK